MILLQCNMFVIGYYKHSRGCCNFSMFIFAWHQMYPLYRLLLWEPQTGKDFPCIWTLNPEPQSIQQDQDINSMGT